MPFWGPDNSAEQLNNITTGWNGIREVIDRRYQVGEQMSFSVPVHPSRADQTQAAKTREILIDAFCGEYGGLKSLTQLNTFLVTPTSETDAFNMITAWIDWQVDLRGGHKIPHQMIFEYILDAHEGNVGFAIRDTMLYFHALSRESRILGDPQVYQEQVKRERFLLNHILPISDAHPFPRDYGFWPNDDLRNRIGEFYHQYWLVYLSMYFKPKTIEILLSTENAFFGLTHGSIKKAMDRRLVSQLGEVQTVFNGLPTSSPTIYK